VPPGRLPLLDLHRHLDGSVRLETILDLARRHGLPLPARDDAGHPLRTFLERGLLANLNTDDPGVSGIDLAHEVRVAAPAAGLTPGMIRQAQANALEMAFLDDGARAALVRRAAAHGRAAVPGN
jgi:adenosine deaminase